MLEDQTVRICCTGDLSAITRVVLTSKSYIYIIVYCYTGQYFSGLFKHFQLIGMSFLATVYSIMKGKGTPPLPPIRKLREQ